MTRQRRFKARIRERMGETGERYTAARAAIEAVAEEPDATDDRPTKGDTLTMNDTRTRDESDESDESGIPTPPEPERAVPILSVRDLEEAEAFYARLGFAAQSRYDGYLILDRSGVELHLSHWEEHDPKTTDGMAYIRVADAQAVYEALRDGLAADGLLYLAPASGLTPELTDELERREEAGEQLIRLHEIEDKPYGVREFAVVDPSGNLLRLGQRLQT